jgi:hypothetical protein
MSRETPIDIHNHQKFHEKTGLAIPTSDPRSFRYEDVVFKCIERTNCIVPAGIAQFRPDSVKIEDELISIFWSCHDHAQLFVRVRDNWSCCSCSSNLFSMRR